MATNHNGNFLDLEMLADGSGSSRPSTRPREPLVAPTPVHTPVQTLLDRHHKLSKPLGLSKLDFPFRSRKKPS